MGAPRGLKAPRVVIDTNCVVSALLFSTGRLTWLRNAWQTSRIVPLIGETTAKELIRVLSYPKFALSEAEQETLLAEFLPYAEAVVTGPSTSAPQALRDPHDAVFFELARRAKADALVSGDKDILALRLQSRSVLILPPAEFHDWLEKSGVL